MKNGTTQINMVVGLPCAFCEITKLCRGKRCKERKMGRRPGRKNWKLLLWLADPTMSTSAATQG